MVGFQVYLVLLLAICTTLLLFAVFHYPGFLYNFCKCVVNATKFLIPMIYFGCLVLVFVGSVLLKIIEGLARGCQFMAPYVHRAALYMGRKGANLTKNFVQHVVTKNGGYFIAAWIGFLAFLAYFLGNHHTRAEQEQEPEDEVQREHAAVARNKYFHRDYVYRHFPHVRELVGDRDYNEVVEDDLWCKLIACAILEGPESARRYNNQLHTDGQQVARVDGGATRNRSIRYGIVGDVNHADFDHEDDQLCVVCVDRARATAVFPCGHTHMCELCTRNVMLERARCPICQQRIMEYRTVFL